MSISGFHFSPTQLNSLEIHDEQRNIVLWP